MPITWGTTKPEIKLLEQCKPGELVRGKFFDKTEWALIANRSDEHQLQNVVVLGDEPPRGFNAYSHGSIMQVSCLNYGDKFRIVPEYDGSCEVDFSLPPVTPGQLIVAEKDVILVAGYTKQIGFKSIAYYYATTKDLKGQPGGQMAIFSKWSIWIEDLFGYPNPSKLLERGVTGLIGDQNC
jgi:hypothetical protein